MSEDIERLPDLPPFGEPVAVAEGVWWLRVPLPFALDQVNLWLLDDGDGWTVVDTGHAMREVQDIWGHTLATLLAGRPVTRIVVTHFHPDHVGQAGWLAERCGAPLLMSRTEWLTARALALDDSPGFAAQTQAHWRRAGMPAEVVERQRAGGNRYRKGIVPPPLAFERLADGDSIVMAGSAWRVIAGEGHAPEMLTFHSPERGLLIAADQILGRITPNISVWASEPEADPLEGFLRTLRPYRSLPADTLVLPSHHHLFKGLHARIDQLEAHHAERLARTLDACAAPVTAAAVVAALFPRALDHHQESFALSEALAHLNRLRRAGELRRWEEGGVWLYGRG